MNDYACNLDANGWQLYSDMRGAKATARALSKKLTTLVAEAKARLAEDDCLSEHKLASKVRDEMYEMMERVAQYGACDTEPSCVLVSELERAFGLREYSLER